MIDGIYLICGVMHHKFAAKNRKLVSNEQGFSKKCIVFYAKWSLFLMN